MLNRLLKPFEAFLPENNRYERIWKLAQVDFKKRYYNDKLGLFWALLNPLLRILVYYLVFKYVIKYDKVDNYGLFLFGGLIVWMTFAEITTAGMHIIKQKKYLIENIQFNKLDLFYSQLISSMMGFAFNMTALIFLILVFGGFLDFNFLLIIFPIVSLVLISLGISMILSTIYIYFRDINHAWSIILLIGFWSSGILFRGEDFIEALPQIVYLNPFIGLIMNVRAVTIQLGVFDWELAAVGFVWGISLFLIGRSLFLKYSGKAIELL